MTPSGRPDDPLWQPPEFQVPAYRDKVVSQKTMNGFLGRHAGAGPNMLRATGEIFAAEGGFRKDPGSSAYAGITDAALKEAQKIDPHLAGIERPEHLTKMQVVRAYQNTMIVAMKRYGGFHVIEDFANADTAAAFADTLFMHGPNGGATIIKDAVNEIISGFTEGMKSRAGLSDLHAGTGPKDTLRALHRLEAIGFGPALRGWIAKKRSETSEDKGARTRFTHFEF